MTRKQKIWTSVFLALAAILTIASFYLFSYEMGYQYMGIFYNSIALVVIAFMAVFPTNEVVSPYLIKKIPSAILVIAIVNFTLLVLNLRFNNGPFLPLTFFGIALLYLLLLIFLVWKRRSYLN